MNYEEPDLISNMRENQQNIEKLKHQTMNNQSNSNGSLLTAVSTAKTTDLALKLNNNESNKISPVSNGKSHVSQNQSQTPLQQQQQQHKQQIEQQNPENNYINFNKINVLKCDNQIKELHTVLRDKHTSHSDFKFYSDRLIRLLVEESLNVLPYSDLTVTTSAGCEYQGVKYIKKVCGVSIMRSGEAMEKGLRECCRSIRIGKILIQSTDGESKKSSVVYAKFPNDVNNRKILLMYPIITSGSTINLAIKVLKEHGVIEENILVLCLFSTPSGLQSINDQYPKINILTSEIHPTVPTDFGQRYFGAE